MTRAIVGLDTSLKGTGLARLAGVGVETRLVEATVGQGLEGVAATVRYQVGAIVKFVPRGALAVIEYPIVSRGGRGGMQLERAYLYWLTIDQLLRLDCLVATVAPQTRAKYATGSGKAQKPAVLAAMKAAHPSVEVKDHNVADALALMGMGARWLGAPVDGAVTSKQLEAMRSAHWPVIGEGKVQ